MTTDTTPRCNLGISDEHLSAYRDHVLPGDEAARLRLHLAGCAACQQRMAEFDSVAWLLRHQRELEPGMRVQRAVRAEIARRPQRSLGMPRRAILGGLGAAVAVIVLVLLFAQVLRLTPGSGTSTITSRPTYTPSGTIVVPNLIGKNNGDVKTVTHQLGLQLDVTLVPSNDAQAHLVLSQSPPAGTHVNPGATIAVTEGGGANFVLLPDVTGQPASSACNQLIAAGFACVVVTPAVQSATVPAGDVVRTDPPAGSGQYKGATISVYVSSGPNPPGTPTPSGAIAVANPTLARDATVAFVLNNDVYASVRGGAAQQVTNLHLGATAFAWTLAWSDDLTRLVAVASTGSYPPVTQGWIITLPGDAVTAIPSSSPIFTECGPCALYWLGNRYLYYVNPQVQTPHAAAYRIYDTTTRQILTTPIDNIEQPWRPVERNGNLYIISAGSASSGPCGSPPVVQQYDPATNALTTLITLTGYTFDIGIQYGSLAVAADGTTFASVTVGDPSGGCTPQRNYTPVALQTTGGGLTALFGFSASQVPPDDLIILSADGRHAAIMGASVVEQENVGTRAIEHNVFPASVQQFDTFWWDDTTPGIFATATVSAQQSTTIATTLYDAPADSSAAFQPVLTVTAQAVQFATNG